jgi:hypothetical protein
LLQCCMHLGHASARFGAARAADRRQGLVHRFQPPRQAALAASRRSHQHDLEPMSGAHNRPRKSAPRAREGLDRENEKSISTAVEGLAWNINIWPPRCITSPTLQHRGESANATSLVASCDISILMSRNWLALVGSQCWGRDAYGSNCSASNHL